MSFESEKKETTATNFLQWVGGSFYSVESYVKEAKKMGASRRVNGVPKNIVKGVSKVFLLSDMATEADRKAYKEEYNRRLREAYNKDFKKDAGKKYGSIQKLGPMPRTKPVIFGYFTINQIVYVTGPGVDVPKELAERGVEIYEYQEGAFGFNDERGCGSLEIGGMYFISEESMEKVKNLASAVELESKNIHIFETPIPAEKYSPKRFRGIKEVPVDINEELELHVAAFDLEQVKKFKAGQTQ